MAAASLVATAGAASESATSQTAELRASPAIDVVAVVHGAERVRATRDADHVSQDAAAPWTRAHRLRVGDPVPTEAGLAAELGVSRTVVREALRAQRIYTPTYWPDVATAEGAPDFERSLPDSTLCLPCDQRLTHNDLAPMVQHLLDRLA